MNDTTYNGWSNFETWRHNLEFVNHESWAEMIPTLEGLDENQYVINWDTVIDNIAMGLEDELDCYIDEMEDRYAMTVVRSAASEINFKEIAENIVADYK